MASTVDNYRSQQWYADRIAYLEQFMTEDRAATLRRVLSMRTRYFTVCTENMFHPQNASALVRHCDAFGIQDIHTIESLCGFRPNVNIVRGTDQWVTFHPHTDTDAAINDIKKAGYRLIATTPHAGDCTPESFDVATGPFALVFGTEHEGISEAIASAADGFLRIPMYGFVESLNVSASAAIILHILTEKVRSTVTGWELSEREQAELLFLWMTRTVKDSRRILQKYETKLGDE